MSHLDGLRHTFAFAPTQHAVGRLVLTSSVHPPILLCSNANGDKQKVQDMVGDTCAFYDKTPTACGGLYDDDDFTAGTMCCSCGGGDGIDVCACRDTDCVSESQDIGGGGCAWYYTHPSTCGFYDDDDFTAGSMCCSCRGRLSHGLLSGAQLDCDVTLQFKHHGYTPMCCVVAASLAPSQLSWSMCLQVVSAVLAGSPLANRTQIARASGAHAAATAGAVGRPPQRKAATGTPAPQPPHAQRAKATVQQTLHCLVWGTGSQSAVRRTAAGGRMW